MPKSKRDRVVPISSTSKKTRVQKQELIQNIQSELQSNTTFITFKVENYRNLYFKEIRAEFKSLGRYRLDLINRFFYGSNRVMQKALGTDPSSSTSSSHLLSPYLSGNTGLLTTSLPLDELRVFLDGFVKRDYLRAGSSSPTAVVVPSGLLRRDGLPLPNNMEPLLRKLGLPTALESGVLVVTRDYKICDESSTLDSSQCSLLKLLGHDLAEFRVVLTACVKDDQLTVL